MFIQCFTSSGKETRNLWRLTQFLFGISQKAKQFHFIDGRLLNYSSNLCFDPLIRRCPGINDLGSLSEICSDQACNIFQVETGEFWIGHTMGEHRQGLSKTEASEVWNFCKLKNLRRRILPGEPIVENGLQVTSETGQPFVRLVHFDLPIKPTQQRKHHQWRSRHCKVAPFKINAVQNS